ncbi:Abi family protein [Lutibacter sp. B2]|nr:Abi family protein [Lutibacter sp. B2]
MADERIKNIKKPTTFLEQIERLKSRNLIIDDVEKAIGILQRINYYRLSAYMLTYKIDDRFRDGVSIEDVHDLYEFDKTLRNLIMEVLETIEIAFRTHIAYLIAHKYDAIGYKDANNFKKQEYHVSMMQKLQEEIDRSDEIFVKHYQGVFPIWVVIELTSFGLLSKIYSNLKDEDQDEIAINNYGIKGEFIRTWTYSLAAFRNICAHYGRIYDRKITIRPKMFREDKKKGIKNDTVFAIILIIGKMLKNDDEWDRFAIRLSALIERYDKIDISRIGFPNNWEYILRNL